MVIILEGGEGYCCGHASVRILIRDKSDLTGM